MRLPLSWLAEHVDMTGLPAPAVAARLTEVGLQVERVEPVGAGVSGVVVARVVEITELTGFKKPIRWVTLTDGSGERQVICGATNFAVGDLVAYARPPAMLPGGVAVERRRAYDHDSDGMICSAAELGVGTDHAGILVLGHQGESDLPLGEDAITAAGLHDTVLDIAVNPDRGYALSIRGIAREVAIAFGREFRDPAATPAAPAGPDPWPVRVEDTAGCDRYLMRSVSGVGGSSPLWLRRRIELCGMRPITLAVDVTNYLMLLLGQPLHGFDRAAVRGPIVVRRAEPGEPLVTLDGVERTLDPDDVVIADDTGAIGLGGVMGGRSTEIGPDTADLLLEAAHFDPVRIARTARRHRISSEAARRFERGVDDDLPPAAAAAAADLLVRLGGGTDAGGAAEVDHRSPRPVILLAAGLPARLAGMPIPPEAVAGRLRDVGCGLTGPAGEPPQFEVTPPPWRPDLRRPVDLVEEVVRLEGYARLPVTVPRAPAGRGLSRRQRHRRLVSRTLAAAGYVEVISPPFVADAAAGALLLRDGDERRPSVRLANPVADDQPWLRASLLPGLLAALARNAGRGFADLALYEIGPVYRWQKPRPAMPRPAAGTRPGDEEIAAMERALPDQPLHLAAALAGQWERAGWWGEGRPATWADAVAAASTVAASLGVPLEVAADRERAPWHPGRCAVLSVGGVVAGHAGELHPRVVEQLSLPARSCALELSLDVLLDRVPEAVAAPRVSAYPPVAFDVAVVVADGVPVAEVTAALAAGAGELLESIRLFDVYRGASIGSGEVSYAFTLRLRAEDRTLTSEEANAVRDAAVAEAAARVGARLRG